MCDSDHNQLADELVQFGALPHSVFYTTAPVGFFRKPNETAAQY